MSLPLEALYKNVLVGLNIYSPQDSIHANDKAVVVQSYASNYDRLKGEGIIAWGPTDEIPDAVSEQITSIIIEAIFDNFPQTAIPYQKVAAKASIAEKQLARYVTGKYVPEVIEAEYF